MEPTVPTCESGDMNVIGVEYAQIPCIAAEGAAMLVLDSPALLKSIVSPDTKEIVLVDSPSRMDLGVY